MPEATKNKSKAWQNDPSTAPKQARTFHTVENNFVSLKEKGDKVEGSLIEKGEQEFRRVDPETNSVETHTVGRYQVKTDDGLVKTFLGSRQLDDLMIPVEIGQYLKIECTGKATTSSGFSVKTYKVEVAD